MDAADGGSSVGIGIRRDGAGVQHDERGSIHIRGRHAEMCQLSLDGCAIGLRRSAPEI
jgi:hypothetical protein